MVVIGAGLGGLAAALRLARLGFSVQVLEARPQPGGLAGSFTIDGLSFDTGPYLLLDQPGLEWAFEELGLDLNTGLDLQRIDSIYSVSTPDSPSILVQASLDETACRLDIDWPGAGDRYRRLITTAEAGYKALSPLQRLSNPGAADMLHGSRWKWLPFLVSSLSSILNRSGLPKPIHDAIGIWTPVRKAAAVSKAFGFSRPASALI